MTGKGLETENLTVSVNGREILRNVSLSVDRGEILCLIGPAGSGKTSFLRVVNRLSDLDKLKVTGEAYLNGTSLLDLAADVTDIRRKIGIVFSVPTPLPMSIYDNLAFGPKINGATNKAELDVLVEKSLRAAYLWDEVKDRLTLPGTNLSGGQQQRLCLARTLMLKPQVLLLDEPCSGLDPISTAKIEEALTELKSEMAIVLVTNNVKQASRVADTTAFLLLGDLIEFAPTQDLFTTPKDRRTEDYITGRFG